VGTVPRGFWASRANRLRMLAKLEAAFGVDTITDWKKVAASDVRLVKNGAGFLQHYNGSILAALRDLRANCFHAMDYTDADQRWLAAKVEKPVPGSTSRMLEFLCRPQVDVQAWSEPKFLRSYLDYLAPRLGVRQRREWSRVSNKLLARQPGGNSLIRHVGLLPALEAAYPEEDWQEMRLQLATKKASQWNLAHVARRLFPTATVEEEHSLGVDGMQLDVYVAEHRLAFEYQGRQHYEETGIMGPLQAIQERDHRKAALAEVRGIRLVHVPYWWDDKLESLAGLVQQRCPGLLAASAALASERLAQTRDTGGEDREQVVHCLGYLKALTARIDAGEGPAPVPISDSTRLPAAWEAVDPEGMWMADGPSSSIAVSWTYDGDLVGKTSMKKIRDVPEEWRRCLPSFSPLSGALVREGSTMMGLIHAVFHSAHVQDTKRQPQEMLDRFGQPIRTSQ